MSRSKGQSVSHEPFASTNLPGNVRTHLSKHERFVLAHETHERAKRDLVVSRQGRQYRLAECAPLNSISTKLQTHPRCSRRQAISHHAVRAQAGQPRKKRCSLLISTIDIEGLKLVR
jgi:hypothetical protein